MPMVRPASATARRSTALGHTFAPPLSLRCRRLASGRSIPLTWRWSRRCLHGCLPVVINLPAEIGRRRSPNLLSVCVCGGYHKLYSVFKVSILPPSHRHDLSPQLSMVGPIQHFRYDELWLAAALGGIAKVIKGRAFSIPAMATLWRSFGQILHSLIGGNTLRDIQCDHSTVPIGTRCYP